MATLSDILGKGAGTVNVNSPGASVGLNRSDTSSVQDPFQKLLLSMLMKQFQENPASVPGFTMGALENFTKNPSAAAEYFPQLAKPLLSALKPTEDREVTQLTDMFRKAGIEGGAQQSGAFAQSGRQLIGDQANRRQETLAKSYIPLTQQLSENMRGNIQAGLDVPKAISAGWQVPAALAGGLAPLSTTSTSASAGSGGAPGVAAQSSAAQAQIARDTLNNQKIADWRNWMGSSF